MSETAEADVEYKHGDVAWVKLGNCYWPGEVVEFEKLPDSEKEELQSSFRNKPPLVIIKFFQEDSYEFARKLDKVFPYNCDKKDEFIKKGMDMHRAKKSNMQKFPEDVLIAEKRSGGNENILEDPKFAAPEKKTKLYSDLFGTPKQLVKPIGSGRGRASLKSQSPSKKAFVTHPRFTGKANDHTQTIMMQPMKRDESKENQKYKCTTCGFNTTRLEAIVLHNKTHLKSDPLYNAKPKKGKKGKRGKRKTMKMTASKTDSIDEDLALLEEYSEKAEIGSDDQAVEPVQKKRRKKRKRQPVQENQASPKKPALNITNDLLAEWDDIDDEEGEGDEDKSMDSVDESLNESVSEENVMSPLSTKGEKLKSPKQQTPRVKAEKTKASEGTPSSENGTKKDEYDFNVMLDETKVPDLPSLPKSKSDDSDKLQVLLSPDVATKLTNPKKRFVKSFEDFELSLKEKEKEKEQTEGDLEQEKSETDDDKEEMQEILDDTQEEAENEEDIEMDPELVKEDIIEKKKEKVKVETPKKEKVKEKEKYKEVVIEPKVTRRSSRFDKKEIEETQQEKVEVKEKEKEKLEEKEKVKEKVEVKEKEALASPLRKSTRKTDKLLKSLAEENEKDKEKEKVVDKPEERKTRSRKDKEREEKPAELIKAEIASAPLLAPEVVAAKSEPVPEVEAQPEPESEIVKAQEPTKAKSKNKEEVKAKEPAKKEDKEPKKDDYEFKESKEKEKEKKEEKPATPIAEEIKDPKETETKTKKESKIYPEVEKIVLAEKPQDKPEKKEKEKEKKTEFKEKEKPKPKEKILTEIDVFGPIRAQENEKYNKKEDSSRRETRASRSKTRSESSSSNQGRKERGDKDEETPRTPKHAKRVEKESKDKETPEEAQVNNGKNEDVTSPLISKMKNKLMNMMSMNTEPEVKSPKHEYKTRGRSSVDEDEKKSEETIATPSTPTSKNKAISKREELEKKREEHEKEKKLKDRELKEKDKDKFSLSRRHSLRNAPLGAEVDDEEKDVTKDNLKEKPQQLEKKIPTKAEVKSSPAILMPTRLEPKQSGPKTYLRASRADKEEKPEKVGEKSPLITPTTSISTIKLITEAKTKVVEPVKVQSPEKLKEANAKDDDTVEVKPKTVEKSEKIDIEEELKTEPKPSTNADEWLQTLSPIKMKVAPVVEEKLDVEELSEGAASEATRKKAPEQALKKTPTSAINILVPIVKPPSSPVKAPSSPVKPASSPVKAPPLPVKAPLSPVKAPPSPIKAPPSPIKAPPSPIKAPPSPVKAPASPVKAPASPVKAPASPVKAPPSPVKTPAVTKAPASPLKSLTSPVRPAIKSPPPPMKLEVVTIAPPSPVKSPVKSPPMIFSSPIKSPLKSPPIILNKDAPKYEPPKKLMKREEEKEMEAPKTVATSGPSGKKSPRGISLTSQEVSFEQTTDKVEITVNNNETMESTTCSPSVSSASSEELTITPVDIEGVKEDALGLLASVSSLNQTMELLERNITVVPEDFLAEGQVEIAKIIEDGTEKIASIPSVQPEKPKPEIVSVTEEPKIQEKVTVEMTPAVVVEKLEVVLAVETEEEKPVDKSVQKPVAPSAKSEPIILNKMSADQESTSKLLDILTDNRRPARPSLATIAKSQQVPLPKIATPKFDIDNKKQLTTTVKQGRIMNTPGSPSTSRTKPTILSDTIIKAATPVPEAVISVQKVKPQVKRTYDDIEDIDAFIITKHKKTGGDSDDIGDSRKGTAMQSKQKPKILEHTIITAAGQVLQPITKVKKAVIQQQTIKIPTSGKSVEEKVYDLLNSPKGSRDDDTFDIDNMPIVLTDQLLTSDNIEGVSVVIQEPVKTQQVQQIIKKPLQQQIKMAPKQVVTPTMRAAPTTKTYTKVVRGQRVYQTSTSTTMLKHSPTIISPGGKPGKYVIVPSQSATPPSGSKYTVGKRPFIKKPAILSKPTQSVVPETTGNKIMIVTNNQGQQQRIFLTPDQQKLMGYQPQVKKTIVKGTPPMQMQTKTKTFVPATSATGSGLMTIKKTKIEQPKVQPPQPQALPKTPKFSMPPFKGHTRTVIIKNQQGEIVNRIHGTSVEDIEKQVAEQLDAINRAASAKMKGPTQMKRVIKKTVRPAQVQQKVTPVAAPARTLVPPLAPISPVKKLVEQQHAPQKTFVRQHKAPAATLTRAPKVEIQQTQTIATPKAVEKPPEVKEERAPKQLVIQDAMGNETTIMEGQILALPSETVDGQPQSYMLVTLDESGSLTPLNNEALMSLDPNLNLGGDLSNMILQIDGGGGVETAEADVSTPEETATVATPEVTAVAETAEIATPAEIVEDQIEAAIPEMQEDSAEDIAQQQQQEAEIAQQLQQQFENLESEAPPEQIQALTCHINKGDIQQQLIITGDPVAAQKFLESLSEGNAEIANLLAHVEGSQILIHTDGQQILINSDVDNQMLLTLNTEAEPSAESLFAAQTSTKNQDILAAALADTDVFQQEQSISTKVTQPQLSPGYPLASINNVLETSTVNSPIMTPLEIPTIITKKIDTNVLQHQIPKNVDLPITITDPNISQSVANQHVSLMRADITTSMELPLTIQDVPTTSTEMNSPSFSYSLPSLDDGDKFTSPISMPLLTEDPEEVQASTTSTLVKDTSSQSSETSQDSDSKSHESTAEYLLATGDMCSMTSQMSSLSEPPPDMFDFPLEQTSAEFCSGSGILVSKSPKRGIEDDASTDDANKRSKLD